MPTTFSSPQVPEVVIGGEDTAERMLLQLAGTIGRGVISDAFSTVRTEQIKKYSTLWEAQELRAETIIKMLNPSEVKDAIDRFKEDYNNPTYPESQKEGLRELGSSLEIHLADLIKKEPSKDVARTLGSFEALITEMNQENSNLNNNADFLSKVLGQMGDEINYYSDKYITRMAEKDDPVPYNITASKYDPETGELIKGSKTPDSKMRQLAQYIKRKPDGDKLLASQFELLANDYQMIDGQLEAASHHETIGESIRQAGLKLDKFKGDKEGFGELSAAVMIELDQSMSDKRQFLTAAHATSIKNMYKEKNSLLSAIKALDHMQMTMEIDPFDSPEAIQRMADAQKFLEIGYEVGDSRGVTFVSEGLREWDRAKREEKAYDVGVAKNIRTRMKQHESSALSEISTISNRIAENMGKGAKSVVAKEKYDSAYLEGGKFELNMNPPSLFTNFDISTKSNMEAFKMGTGINIAKLVKSSKLADNEEVNELVNEAMNVDFTTAKRVEALDELFTKFLDGKSKDLDFIGTDWGKDFDTNTKNLYSDWLDIYKTLDLADKRATAEFGTDYGYGQVQQYSHILNQGLDALMQNISP